ncbi:hypothetical protein AB0O47_39790, partial [Streptomyces noursei]
YGLDVTRTPAWLHLRCTMMLTAACYAVALAEHNEAARPDAQHRVDCLLGRRGGGPHVWKPVALRPGDDV